MAQEHTLLRRIGKYGSRGVDRPREASAVDNVRALEESVRLHLNQLLNSRHGMSEALPDYGLPALTDLTGGTANYARLLQEAIRLAVEKYEPRLRRVRVTRQEEDETAQKMVFRVEGELQSRSGRVGVSYQAAVADNGHFDVKD